MSIPDHIESLSALSRGELRQELTSLAEVGVAGLPGQSLSMALQNREISNALNSSVRSSGLVLAIAGSAEGRWLMALLADSPQGRNLATLMAEEIVGATTLAVERDIQTFAKTLSELTSAHWLSSSLLDKSGRRANIAALAMHQSASAFVSWFATSGNLERIVPFASSDAARVVSELSAASGPRIAEQLVSDGHARRAAETIAMSGEAPDYADHWADGDELTAAAMVLIVASATYVFAVSTLAFAALALLVAQEDGRENEQSMPGADGVWSLSTAPLELRQGVLEPEEIADLATSVEPLWGLAQRLYEDGDFSGLAMVDFPMVREGYQLELRRASPDRRVLGARITEVAKWVAECEHSPATDLERCLVQRLDGLIEEDGSRSIESGRDIAVQAVEAATEAATGEDDLSALDIVVDTTSPEDFYSTLEQQVGIVLGWRERAAEAVADVDGPSYSQAAVTTGALVSSLTLLFTKDPSLAVTLGSSMGGAGVLLRAFFGLLKMYLGPFTPDTEDADVIE